MEQAGRGGWVHVRGRRRETEGGLSRGRQEADWFPKCPRVDTHSSVTFQQTYYLLFCHFGVSTSNSGQDSISAPETAASRTRAPVHTC